MAAVKAGQWISELKIVPTAGCYNCWDRCLHKVYVTDGVATRAEPDQAEDSLL